MDNFTSTDSGATILSKLNDIVPKINNLAVTVGTDAGCDYVCDGTEDDIQIQAAIDYIVAAGGGIVHIKNGDYYLSSALSIKSRIILEGEGRTTVLHPETGKNGIDIYAETGSIIGMVLRDFRITGETGTLIGINITRAASYEITQFSAENVATYACGTGLYNSAPFKGVFTNCIFEYGVGDEYGMDLQTGEVLLNSCWFEHLAVALKLRGQSTVQANNCKFSGNTANYTFENALGYYPVLQILPIKFYAQGNVTGATTFDIGNGHVISATLTGAITATLSDGRYRGEILKIILTQGGTGSYGYTKDATNKLAGGSITLSTAVGAIDIIEFVWNGALWEEVSRSLNLS